MDESNATVLTDPESARPLIDVGDPLVRTVDEGWRALLAANDPVEPRVMLRGNVLVRMTERGALEELTLPSMRDELSRAGEWGRETKDGWTSKDPPRDVAETLLHRDSKDLPGAPA